MDRNPNAATLRVFEALIVFVVSVIITAIAIALIGSRANGAEFTVVADHTVPAPVFVVVDRTVVDDTPTDLTKPAPPGWEKVSVNGGPWHFRKVKTIAPAVRDPHACPSCSRFQYTVDGFNADGTHRHRCPVDGTTWDH